MDNVVLVTFEDEGKAYEEFNRLKDNEATADFTILEMAVVKNVDGAIMVPDGFQDGYDETDNTAFGGVTGAVTVTLVPLVDITALSSNPTLLPSASFVNSACTSLP